MFPGLKPQNHPSQQKKRRRRAQQIPMFPAEWLSFAELDGELDGIDDRETPDDLFGKYHARHAYTVDAAAAPHNAKLPRFWTRKDDGLAQSWDGERVWCNPPFSRLEPWAEKAHHSHLCEVATLLTPANRCEQPWWQKYVEPFRDGRVDVDDPRHCFTEFIARRVQFKVAGVAEQNSTSKNPPFGIVMITWVRVPF